MEGQTEVGLALGAGMSPCGLRDVRTQEGEVSPGEQVSGVPLKGLAGKADECVAQTLEKGEGCPQSGVPPGSRPPSCVLCALCFLGRQRVDFGVRPTGSHSSEPHFPRLQIKAVKGCTTLGCCED